MSHGVNVEAIDMESTNDMVFTIYPIWSIEKRIEPFPEILWRISLR